MWSGASARWARCRAPHLSSFARQVNLGFQGHRSLVSAPVLTRLCAELRPPQGFTEQRLKTPGTSLRLHVGEALDEANSTASRQAVAAILESVAALGSSSGCTLSEIFDVCMALGCVHRTCQCISCASWPILNELWRGSTWRVA
mmetsp:Transcript_107828/g.300634  ORF Transcript_107828/g.300634 Transcript_107828/m.300634 type:complete len:144 (+) Transcript_107828:167-598(+)